MFLSKHIGVCPDLGRGWCLSLVQEPDILVLSFPRRHDVLLKFKLREDLEGLYLAKPARIRYIGALFP